MTCPIHPSRETAGEGRSGVASPPAAVESPSDLETLSSVAQELNSGLELHTLVQRVTDAGVSLTDAALGAFFFNTTNEKGESYVLYTLSGQDREAFANSPLPRNTPLFGPTFRGEGMIRIADVRTDPRYGQVSPYYGMPPGHPPVRSYLAAPVISRSGEVIGGLFFGHPEPNVFTDRAERLAKGLAAQAAIAIDNARLTDALRQELKDRRTIEAALRQSEVRYRELVKSLPAAVYTCDAEGRVQLYNDAAAELWGREPEVGQEWWCGSYRILRLSGEPMPPDEYPMAIALKEDRVIRNQEIIIERPDGLRRRVLPHSTPIHDASGRLTGAINMLLDVTEQRQAEAAKGLLASIVESSDDAMVSKTLDGTITSWNAGAERIFGYAPSEAVGRSITLIIPPDRLDEERDILARLRRGERIDHFETIRLTKDGRRIHISVTVSPVRNADGVITGASKVARDITRQKEAEAELARYRDQLETLVRERTEALHESHERLRLAERMSSLGTLSAGLGHDMGNLLMPVRVRLESLSASDLPAHFREDVEAIRTATDYLQRLASGLRLLAIDPARAASDETTELGSWWGDAGPLLRNALPRGVKLIAELPGDPCSVLIPRAALTQAVFNLVQNAGDAMRVRGTGAVNVWARPEGDAVIVGVSDDGPGMSDEVRRRCMEPFFTTKPRGISTGLGLALVFGVVQSAGGTIDLDTRPGKGTTFRLRLRPAPTPGSGRAKTAVVDLSDRRLQAYASAELKRLRYDVGFSANGSGPPDVLIAEHLDGPHAVGDHTSVVLVGGGAGAAPDARVRVRLEKQAKPQDLRDAIRSLADNGSVPRNGDSCTHP